LSYIIFIICTFPLQDDSWRSDPSVSPRLDSFRKVFSQGDTATVKVDYARRQNIAPNHTCTHVLNHALLATLGGDISQKGSLVRP
jgi:alanyl-tRNA synthetase